MGLGLGLGVLLGLGLGLGLLRHLTKPPPGQSATPVTPPPRHVPIYLSQRDTELSSEQLDILKHAESACEMMGLNVEKAIDVARSSSVNGDNSMLSSISQKKIEVWYWYGIWYMVLVGYCYGIWYKVLVGYW